eukprot:366546-Chlamydomonas_euryale.AAC.46
MSDGHVRTLAACIISTYAQHASSILCDLGKRLIGFQTPFMMPRLMIRITWRRASERCGANKKLGCCVQHIGYVQGVSYNSLEKAPQVARRVSLLHDQAGQA